MKIDRLIAIINYLLRNGKTSAQKLSEAFEVSTRTIMRDIETLEQAGIPIQSIMGAEGGYSIMDTYVMDKKLMTPQNYEHMITALRGLLSAHGNGEMQQTLDKVMPLYDSVEPIIKLDFSVAKEREEINQYLLLLEKAVTLKKVVAFEYTNSENVTKQLRVEPVRLEVKWRSHKRV